jgi:2-dehydropantoate 2-reductase
LSVRILVVGAGGVGGYFGGRLLQAGRDVTFLVRERRAAQLAQTGLIIRSPCGDADLRPPVVTAANLRGPFELIVLAFKAYDLETAIDSFAPAVGATTAILPLLNGMRHLEVLDARFSAATVLGGLATISADVDAGGRIHHLNNFHSLSFGARDGTSSRALDAIAQALSNSGFEARQSGTVLQEMWEKWVFIAAAAGLTCLMRATVSDIVQAGAGELAGGFLGECAGIATANGFAPGAPMLERSRAFLSAPGSTFSASMLRDVERGGATEADHVIGDLLRRGAPTPAHPLLRLAWAHLKAYEARRARG